jgi:signal transduction histidine kinase
MSQAPSSGDLLNDARMRLAESRSLQAITTTLLRRLNYEEVLAIIRREARNMTGAQADGIYLVEGGSWLREANQDPEIGPSSRIPLTRSHTGQVVLTGRPLIVNDYKGGMIEARAPMLKTESLLAVPLRIEDSIIGVLNVANKPGGFSDDDARMLSLLANVAAIAIENARLRREAGDLAVSKERQWLARELHDSVTQALYSVTLYAEAARMALAEDKHEAASENLVELQAMAREALFEIRLLIFELHPPILEDQGLSAAIQVRLSSVEGRAGLQTDLDVHGERRLPLSQEEDIYRIVLEALNNVVKHARARHVSVRLKFCDEFMYIEIKDDGRGFDMDKADGRGGMGLKSMKERAKRINADLEILSKPGDGSTLKLTMPL